MEHATIRNVNELLKLARENGNTISIGTLQYLAVPVFFQLLFVQSRQYRTQSGICRDVRRTGARLPFFFVSPHVNWDVTFESERICGECKWGGKSVGLEN